MLRREIRTFFTALMFYTRIPCPEWVDHSEDYLNRATKYFPLMGWIVGGTMAATVYAMHWVLPLAVAIGLAMAIGILLTGAFHEDGFADVCDGFGGGWTAERILEIMKDSQVGAYGSIGVVMILLLKFQSLSYLPIEILPWALISAHAASRWAAVTVIFTHEYARQDAQSKAKPIAKQMSTWVFVQATVWAWLPALGLLPAFGMWIALFPLVMQMTAAYLAAYFRRWLGGYTGDCLGAIQQVSELMFYLVCLAMWQADSTQLFSRLLGSP